MRVAVVTESFLPQINGVTNSVLRVCEHLRDRGHEAIVLTPGVQGPREYAGAQVLRGPSLPLPGYRDFALGLPWPRMTSMLRSFAPDVIHLASPTLFGGQGVLAAQKLGIPSVAVFQTDLAGFAARYRLTALERTVWRWLCGIHSRAVRTLAPSRHAVMELESRGVERVRRWARGVDLVRFNPRHRDEGWRAQLGGEEKLIVGYVGRLAHEKEVDLLASVDRLPGVQVVVTGDGPQRAALSRALPRAQFLGFQTGAALSKVHASVDLFVHTGSHETFCQAAQEALASGVPVVAPAAGGLLDLVTPGETGYHFKPGDSADLAAQVARLRDSDWERRAMGAAARRSVQGRSWSVIGDELLDHYREVAA